MEEGEAAYDCKKRFPPSRRSCSVFTVSTRSRRARREAWRREAWLDEEMGLVRVLAGGMGWNGEGKGGLRERWEGDRMERMGEGEMEAC